MPEVMNAIVITIVLRPIEDVARVLPRDICIVPDFCGVATCQMKDAANFAKLLNGGEFAEQGGQTDIRAVGELAGEARNDIDRESSYGSWHSALVGGLAN